MSARAARIQGGRRRLTAPPGPRSQVIERACEKHQDELVLDPSLEDIVNYDLWARKYVEEECVTSDMAL